MGIPTDVSSFRAIVNRRDAAINLYLNPGGVPTIAMVLNGTEIDVSGPTAVALNVWTHVAATYDGTTIRLYVNGTEVASAAATGAVEASTSRFEIGSPFWSVFAGTLDEVRIYRSARSATEIAADSAESNEVPPPAIVSLDPSFGPVGQTVIIAGTNFNPTQGSSAVTFRGVTATITAWSDTSIAATVPATATSGPVVVTVGNVASNAVTFSVISSPPPCSYGVLPTSVASDVSGTSGTIAVSATWGCQVSPAVNVPWMATTPPAGYAARILQDAPSGYWRLDETTTADEALDSSGHDFNGFYSGIVAKGTPTPFADGNLAATFDHGAIDVGYRSELNPAGSFSLEAWVHMTDPTVGIVAGAYDQGYGTWGYALQLNGTHARFRADNDSVSIFDIENTQSLNDGLWHHLVGVFDVDSSEARLFVDGALTAMETATGQPFEPDNFVIGASDQGYDGFVAASIDEVAYFPVALSASQIAEHFTARGASAPPESGTMGYTVPYVVSANPTGAGRTGLITFGTSSVTVTQPGLPCNYSVSPTVGYMTANGGPFKLTVNVLPSCAWFATSDSSWVTLTDRADGYRGQVLADGPIGYWRLDEIDSPTAYDSSGYGFDGELLPGSTQGVPGVTADGNAATIGGVFVGDVVPLLTNAAFSFEMWVKPAGYVTGRGWRLYGSGGHLVFAGTEGESYFFNLTSARTFSGDAWHHVVATSDAANLAVQLFIDGVLDASATMNLAPYNIRPQSLTFGGGTVDEVAVYARILTAAQVAQHYEQRWSSIGGGPGVVTYTVAENTSFEPRVGLVHAAGFDIPISQAGHACFEVAPLTISVGTSGGSGTIHVTALDSGCAWTATSSASWAMLDVATGTGTGDVQYTVAANSTALNRIATLTIAGHIVSLTQAFAPLQRPTLRYSIAASSQHVLAVKDDGSVWSWGVNDSGQLGTGTTNNRSVAGPVSGVSGVVAVAAGTSHSLALDTDGQVWAWGANNLGQIGDGTNTYRNSPVQVPGLSNVMAIAAGDDHSIVVKADGTVWAWGRNASGQLGDATTTTRFAPVHVASLSVPAAAIAAGSNRTLVVDVTGSVWKFGSGWTSAPTLVDQLPSDIGGIALSGGDAFALTLDGLAWGWGYNNAGQLGDGSTTNRFDPTPLPAVGAVAQIQAADSHTLALRADGSVWAWGAKNLGQLGDGTPPCPSASLGCSPTQISVTPLLVAGPTAVVAIAAHGDSSFAVGGDGRVWSWGGNGSRQLGDGTIEISAVALQIADAAFAWHTGAPLITPGGTYSTVLAVYGASATAGATIHYTLDGADPTESDPTLPTSPASIAVTHTATLKARAWSPGRPPSRLVTATYTLVVPTPTINPAAGTYTSAQTVTLTSSLTGATIRYTIDNSTPTSTSAVYTSPISVSTGTVVKAIGYNDGWTPSAMVSATYVMNFGTLSAPVISPAPGTYIYGQQIVLAGDAFASIHYTTNGSMPTLASPTYSGPLTLTGPTTIVAMAFHPDWTSSVPSSAAYAAKVATPTFTPDGGTYAPGQTIAIAVSTPAAFIHFTKNGVDPTINDPVVTNALSVGNFTLKARAFRDGLVASDVKAAEYVRSGDPCHYSATPNVISAGPHPSGGVVTVSAGDSSCTWTVTSDSSWLTVDSPGGSGVSGQFAYHLAANTGSALRTGLLTIGSQDLLVIQSGQATCTYEVTPSTVAVPADAANGMLAVAPTDGACTWGAASNVPWAAVGVANGTSAYAQAVLDDHPISYWRLNEATGSSIAADASPSLHTGTYHGGVTRGQAGPLADGTTAIMFDGATGFIDIPHSSAFDVSALTWEAWINVSSTSTEWRKLLGKGPVPNEMFSLQLGPNMTQPTLYWMVVGGGRQAVTLSAPVVGAGWVHLAFTYDGTTWHAYINGQEDQSGSLTDALATNTSAVVFGRDDALPQSWYNGRLDEVALYSYAATVDQIPNHFAHRTMTAVGDGQVSYTVAQNTTGATRAGVLTVAGIAVPITQASVGGVVISGRASPVPNAAGWNNTDVTVSFQCAGTGTITCPPPVTVTQEGTQDISGQASSDTGATASTTVRVQIDKSFPVMMISTPALGTLVEPGPLVVTGTVFDALSGVTTVTCNNQAAVFAGGSFSCGVTVPSGTSTITVQAIDAAWNSRASALSIDTTDTATTDPPTSLRLTPQDVTMVIGETHGFSLVDNLGRIPTNAVWTIDDANVATLVTTPEVRLTAVAVGEVTLTATWAGLTASTHVTVVAVSVVATGTTLWSAPAIGGAIRTVVQGATAPDGIERTYVIDGTGASNTSDTIRAFDNDGRELWSVSAGGGIIQLSGDPAGGVVALIDGVTIRRFDASGRGGVTLPLGDYIDSFAIHPNGAVYAVVGEQDKLTAFDIGLGSGPSESIPPGTWTYCPASGCVTVPTYFATGTPTVLADGRVVVPFTGGERIDGPTQYPMCRLTLGLLFLAENGSTTVRQIPYTNEPQACGAPFYLLKAVPNGLGGFLVQTQIWPSGGLPGHAAVTGIDAAGMGTGGILIGNGWTGGGLVIEEPGNGETRVLAATVVLNEPGSSPGSHVGMVTKLTQQGTYGGDFDIYGPAQAVTSLMAMGGGGFLSTLKDGTVYGPDAGFAQMHLRSVSFVAGNRYTGIGTGGTRIEAQAGPIKPGTNSNWPAFQGAAHRANVEAAPGRGIFVKGHRVEVADISVPVSVAISTPYRHSTLRIVPRHQQMWFEKSPELFYSKDSEGQLTIPNYDEYGNRYFTLGAGPATLNGTDPDFSNSCGGLLESKRNRNKDVNSPATDLQRTFYPSVIEDVVINALIQLSNHYNANKVSYGCFPAANDSRFNSNSFVAGLLSAANVGTPVFPLLQQQSFGACLLLSALPPIFGEAASCEVYPGWTKPVPPERFR